MVDRNESGQWCCSVVEVATICMFINTLAMNGNVIQTPSRTRPSLRRIPRFPLPVHLPFNLDRLQVCQWVRAPCKSLAALSHDTKKRSSP